MVPPDFTSLSTIPYGRDYLYRVALAVAAMFPGTTINEAKTTESVYISIPGAVQQVRLSSHQQYGSNVPYQIIPCTKRGLPALVDRAVRAAITGARRYSDVKFWEDIESGETLKISKLVKRGFKYYNFLGLVPVEFPFHPQSEHAWETEGIRWFTLNEIERMIEDNPSEFHPGLLKLLKQSGEQIRQICEAASNKSTEE